MPADATRPSRDRATAYPATQRSDPAAQPEEVRPVTDQADLVVVGAGTVGGWASVFAAADGATRTVVVERGLAGMGASSRAAGIVRAQGGTPSTVALGRWTIEFYNGQQAAYGTDSGFRELGYLILAVTDDDERAGRERLAMQRRTASTSAWLDAAEASRVAVTLAPTGHRGGTYIGTDGAIDPPRNVRAYSLAMQAAGVDAARADRLHRLADGTDGGWRAARDRCRHVRRHHRDGTRPAHGRAQLAVGRPARRPADPAGAARHTVCVLEPHPAFDVERMPMVFDIGEGLYWRLEEGGLLFGYSDPDETPGEARQIDWAFHERMRERLGGLVPLTKDLGLRRIWVATIDYTPDHLPILGPGAPARWRADRGRDGRLTGRSRDDVGAGVARVAADLALRGSTPDRRHRSGPGPVRRARREPPRRPTPSRCRSRWWRMTTTCPHRWRPESGRGRSRCVSRRRPVKARGLRQRSAGAGWPARTPAR